MAEQVLGRRALNRALLARQLLLERSTLPPLAAVEQLVGMQAQSPTPPYFGLWSRLADFDPELLSGMIVTRQVVRLAMMRSTVHLVSAADCVSFRTALQPAVGRGMTPGSPYGKALAGVDLAELAAVGRAMVEKEPLSGAELGAALQRRWPATDAQALAFGVRALVPLVQVPPRGTWGGVGQARTTSAEQWLGTDLAAPDLAGLVRRYLAGYGPAGVRDAQAWSGLSGLGAVFKALRPELVTFRDENGVELFDLPDAPRPAADARAPVRLLPDFDGILLAHADRSRIFDTAHRPLLFSVNGIIHSSVLVDGFVRALWKMKSERETTTVTVTTLPVEDGKLLSARDRAAVIREADRILQFASPGRRHEVIVRALD